MRMRSRLAKILKKLSTRRKDFGLFLCAFLCLCIFLFSNGVYIFVNELTVIV